MNNQGLDADDIINQLHDVIVGRRLSLPDTIKSDMLEALAICDAAIRRSTYARIHFENFLHKVAKSENITDLHLANLYTLSFEYKHLLRANNVSCRKPSSY